MDNQLKTPKRQDQEQGYGYNLYDNIVFDVYQKQLQQHLLNHKESQKIYDEIVTKGKQKIDQEFHDHKKALDAGKRIHKSSLINRSHMMKSQLRFKMCQQVFTQVLHRIHQQIQDNEDQYCLILIKLIVEGALRMFQPQLHIRCLPKHAETVSKVLRASQQTFSYIMKQQTGRNYPIKLQISRQNILKQRNLDDKFSQSQLSKKKEDQQCIGGIILSDLSGNITYKNTIDTRLNILKQICLPMLRTALWPSYSTPEPQQKQKQ